MRIKCTVKILQIKKQNVHHLKTIISGNSSNKILPSTFHTLCKLQAKYSPAADDLPVIHEIAHHRSYVYTVVVQGNAI